MNYNIKRQFDYLVDSLWIIRELTFDSHPLETKEFTLIKLLWVINNQVFNKEWIAWDTISDKWHIGVISGIITDIPVDANGYDVYTHSEIVSILTLRILSNEEYE